MQFLASLIIGYYCSEHSGSVTHPPLIERYITVLYCTVLKINPDRVFKWNILLCDILYRIIFSKSSFYMEISWFFLKPKLHSGRRTPRSRRVGSRKSMIGAAVGPRPVKVIGGLVKVLLSYTALSQVFNHGLWVLTFLLLHGSRDLTSDHSPWVLTRHLDHLVLSSRPEIRVEIQTMFEMTVGIADYIYILKLFFIYVVTLTLRFYFDFLTKVYEIWSRLRNRESSQLAIYHHETFPKQNKHEVVVVKEFEDVGHVHRDGAVRAKGGWVGDTPGIFTTVIAYYKRSLII